MLKFKNFRGKIQEASLKFIIPEEVPVKERNAFMGAAAAAHKAGKSHFDFGGKKHKVTMQGSTASAINSGVTEQVKMGRPIKGTISKKGVPAAGPRPGEPGSMVGGVRIGKPIKGKISKKGVPAAAFRPEGAKPDFLDLDKDGDKKETMKKAANDAKKKKGEKPELKMNPKQDEVDEAKSDLDKNSAMQKRAAKLMNTGYPYGPYRKPKPKKLKPDSAVMSNVKSILRHPKAGGNTSWAAKQIAMTHGRKALKHPSIDRALRKHAETNEAIKYTHAVVDGTGKVAGMTSLGKERDAKDIARRHKGKVIKLKKPMSSKKGDMMINRPFKEETNESIGKTPGDRSYYNLQKAKELAKKAGHDYDKLPQYDRRHNDHKDYFDNKARNESKLNELSPKTLSNYAQKAAMDMGTKDYVRGFEKGQSMMGLKRKEDPKDKKKSQNRLGGIITATDKLRRKTNEDQHDDDGANHIVMQLRKAVTLRGMRPVTFKDGKKVRVEPSHAQKFLTKYNKAKPMDKEKMQAMAHKSHDHFKKSLDEISVDKLNRYVNKASGQLYHLGKQQGKQDMQQPGDDQMKHYGPMVRKIAFPKHRFGLSDTEKKGSKRIAGIMHATSKMVDKAKKKK